MRTAFAPIIALLLFSCSARHMTVDHDEVSLANDADVAATTDNGEGDPYMQGLETSIGTGALSDQSTLPVLHGSNDRSDLRLIGMSDPKLDVPPSLTAFPVMEMAAVPSSFEGTPFPDRESSAWVPALTTSLLVLMFLAVAITLLLTLERLFGSHTAGQVNGWAALGLGAAALTAFAML